MYKISDSFAKNIAEYNNLLKKNKIPFIKGASGGIISGGGGGGNLEIGAEEGSIPVVDGAETGGIDNIIVGNQITIPSTSDMYLVTAVEWKNGATVAGNVIGGVALVDADPAVSVNMLILGNTASTVQTPINEVQKADLTSGFIVKGGTKLIGFILLNNASSRLRYLSSGTQNRSKAFTFSTSIPPFNTTAWGTSIAKMYVKIYYRPITEV